MLGSLQNFVPLPGLRGSIGRDNKGKEEKRNLHHLVTEVSEALDAVQLASCAQLYILGRTLLSIFLSTEGYTKCTTLTTARGMLSKFVYVKI